MVIRRSNTIPFWKIRPRNLRRVAIFESPEELWDAACEFFEWCDKNPIPEGRVVATPKDGSLNYDVDHPRPYTLTGLCSYIGIHTPTWRHWRRTREDLLPTMQMIDDIITTQKFEGAAVGLFNPMIISRSIGLAEKKELSGPGGEPLQLIHANMTEREAADAYAATLNGLDEEESDDA